MKLKDFIVSAISDLAEGVAEADNVIREHGGMVNPGTHRWDGQGHSEFIRPRTSLNFDIAVSATSSGDAKAGVAAKIWVVEASVGGNSEKRSESVSRLTFELDVVLPSDEEQKGRLGNVRSPKS